VAVFLEDLQEDLTQYLVLGDQIFQCEVREADALPAVLVRDRAALGPRCPGMIRRQRLGELVQYGGKSIDEDVVRLPCCRGDLLAQPLYPEGQDAILIREEPIRRTRSGVSRRCRLEFRVRIRAFRHAAGVQLFIRKDIARRGRGISRRCGIHPFIRDNT
jgi:hypothetical protein